MAFAYLPSIRWRARLRPPRSSLVGCPVLSDKRQELGSAFVGEKRSRTVERVDVRGTGDQVGEPVRAFDVENLIAGAPGDKGDLELGQPGPDRCEVLRLSFVKSFGPSDRHESWPQLEVTVDEVCYPAHWVSATRSARRLSRPTVQ
jgi:hypothetical protein